MPFLVIFNVDLSTLIQALHPVMRQDKLMKNPYSVSSPGLDKAFSTVHHERSMAKLEMMDVHCTECLSMTSYLESPG